MSYKLVVKDAVRQLLWRIISAIAGFFVVKLISPYLGPLRFGDYNTILKYFAIRSALADFGIYVIGLKTLGAIDEKPNSEKELKDTYGKFVFSKLFLSVVIYGSALVIAYLMPAYTENPFLIRGLPISMFYTATFTLSTVIQLPLQIKRKMEQVSIGLILARVTQLAVIVIALRAYPKPDFSSVSQTSLRAFIVIALSVLVSGATQLIYTIITAQKYIPLSIKPDMAYTRALIQQNRKFGVAYFLSSFHMLVVTILLSVMYPTIQSFDYSGIRGLALSLIEILLIVPSALGNSLLHKISHSTTLQKRKSFGALMSLVVTIAILCMANFFLFATPLIGFISGPDYLASTAGVGADTILPWLGIVLILSFIKQIFNYLFVATDTHNTLLGINTVGVLIGTSVGVGLVLHYQLAGGIATQVLLEVLFAAGAIWVAIKQGLMPIMDYKHLAIKTASILIPGLLVRYILWEWPLTVLYRIPLAIAFNGISLGVLYKNIKKTVQGLVEE